MSMNAPQGVIPQWTAEDRLLKARRLAGLTQPELARLLGISEKTVKRYEAGESTKRGIVLGWALACGVNAQWLETGITPPQRPDRGPEQDESSSGCSEIIPLRPRRAFANATQSVAARRAS